MGPAETGRTGGATVTGKWEAVTMLPIPLGDKALDSAIEIAGSQVIDLDRLSSLPGLIKNRFVEVPRNVGRSAYLPRANREGGQSALKRRRQRGYLRAVEEFEAEGRVVPPYLHDSAARHHEFDSGGGEPNPSDVLRLDARDEEPCPEEDKPGEQGEVSPGARASQHAYPDCDDHGNPANRGDRQAAKLQRTVAASLRSADRC